MPVGDIDPGCRKEETHLQSYDLIIIGAGPAGLFSAISSQQQGKRILILEKMKTPGKKLLISGSGQCNITHQGNIRDFTDRYGDHGRFLRPALMGFTNDDLISFFRERGLSMVAEESGKVFPASRCSEDVLSILLTECRSAGIALHCGQPVRSVNRSEEGFQLETDLGRYLSPLLVIAAGGCSYPATGSSGDGYRLAAALGHSICEVAPALTPVRIKDYPFSDLAGVSLQDIDISILRDRKIRQHRGDLLFTHHGLSGPGILDLSRYIRAGDILKLSFIPSARREQLQALLLNQAESSGSRGVKSALEAFCLPSRLLGRILHLSGIAGAVQCAQLTRDMRTRLIDHLTGFPVVVEGLEGFSQAMVTRGGVDLKEVDRKTMQSRLVPGLYLAGEVLDVDGDTGGYNLQAAFSTGCLAGESIRRRWES